MGVDRPICRAPDGEDAARISFHRHAPPPELRGLVETLWTFAASPDGKALTDTILPDFGTEIICRVDGERHAFLRGPRLRLEEVAIAPGARYVGARLRPGVAPRLFNITAREACGPRLALEELDCRAARTFDVAGLKQLTQVLIDLFRQRSHTASPRIAERAADLISLRQGRISAEDVASEMGCSPRHLHRAMIADLGTGPKTVARIVRIRRAIALLGAGDTTLAATAIDAGYADQAHMTRDFSALGVTSPARLKQWDESDFINTVERARL